MKRIILATICAAAVLAPQAAFSQDPPASDTVVDAETKAAPEKVFGAGDFDILTSFGFNIVYVHIEPALDVGVIPIGKDLTLSLGGGLGLGYCLLCGALSAVTSVNISSTYWFPYGRANLHLGTLGGIIPADVDGMSLDPYVGVFGGPQFYSFRFEFEGESNTRGVVSQTSFRLGPALGLRLGFKKNRLLVFGEYRWGAEIGFTTVQVENDDGTVYDLTADNYARRGSDFVLGVGLRI